MNPDLLDNLRRSDRARLHAEHATRCAVLGIPAGTSRSLVAVFNDLPELMQTWLRHQQPNAYITIAWLRIQAAEWRRESDQLAPEQPDLARSARHYADQLLAAAELAEAQEKILEAHHAIA